MRVSVVGFDVFVRINLDEPYRFPNKVEHEFNLLFKFETIGVL